MEDMIAGARVEIAPYKRDPADFVLWKPSDADQPGWDNPFAMVRGRPAGIRMLEDGALLSGEILTFMLVALIWCFRITRMRSPSHAVRMILTSWLNIGCIMVLSHGRC